MTAFGSIVERNVSDTREHRLSARIVDLRVDLLLIRMVLFGNMLENSDLILVITGLVLMQKGFNLLKG